MRFRLFFLCRWLNGQRTLYLDVGQVVFPVAAALRLRLDGEEAAAERRGRRETGRLPARRNAHPHSIPALGPSRLAGAARERRPARPRRRQLCRSREAAAQVTQKRF